MKKSVLAGFAAGTLLSVAVMSGLNMGFMVYQTGKLIEVV